MPSVIPLLESQPPSPANDAPISRSIRTSALAPPAEPMMPTAAMLAAAKIDALLPAALQWLKGKELAFFNWQTVSGQEGETTVVVSAVEDSTLEFTWSPTNQKQTVTVKVEAVREEVYLRVRVGTKWRYWCLVDAEGAADWIQGKGVSSTLPNPKLASGLEYLGQVWFSDNNSHDSGVHRQGASPAWRLPAIERFWPQFRLKKSRRVWEVAQLPSLAAEDAEEAWGGTVAAFAIWSQLTLLFQEAFEEDEPGPELFGLPAQRNYFPQRAVNLNGSEVLRELQTEAYRLEIPWHVIEAACASLNAGKHVLFTGPPGCGKSKLAVALAQIATGRRALLVTASPAWTSGDLIGRYLPVREGQGLTFAPGAFLKAVEQERWLVVDEFNRANVDECFGELFSVLANDTVELPFEELILEESGGQERKYGPVRIVPALRRAEAASDKDSEYCDYQVSPSFRLVGTMNDADRATLHQLSFALQRRFDVIRIEAPPWGVVLKIIEKKSAQLAANLERHSYKFFQKAKINKMEKGINLDALATEFFCKLFARNPRSVKNRGDVVDLVSERVIGIATVKDVMNFVGEGLRGPVGKGGHSKVLLEEDMTTHHVAASYVAMGIVLSVFPQLDAIETNRLVQIVHFIVDVFRDRDGKSLPLLRLATVEGREEQFTVQRVAASDGTVIDQDGDNWISIPEYMISELTRQFKGRGIDQALLSIIRREPQASDEV
ncbi:MAG: AAA family ATPase [Deltaproteobacteria bacterium]